jgi:hypothetical protein
VLSLGRLAIIVLSLTAVACAKSEPAPRTPAAVYQPAGPQGGRLMTAEMAEDRNLLRAVAMKDLDCNEVQLTQVRYMSDSRTMGMGDPLIAQENYLDKDHTPKAFEAKGCGRSIEYLRDPTQEPLKETP